MGRDHDEDDRGGERERKRHKKDRHHDRELSQSRSRQKDKTRDTSKRRDDKDRHNGSERAPGRERRSSRERERRREGDRDKDRRDRDRKESKRRRSRSKDPQSESVARDARLEPPADPALPSHMTSEMKEKERRDKEAAELDDEAARRRQRVALWQEQRRAAQQAEEAEAQKQAAASEQWTLDDDIANEYGQVADRANAAQDLAEGSGEVDPLDAFMNENDKALDAARESEEEIDPLDAFMAQEIAPIVRQTLPTTQSVKVAATEDIKPIPQVKRFQRPARRRRPGYYSSDESSDDDEAEDEDSDDEAWAKNVTAGKLSKSDNLGQVDHSTMNYPPFRRNFYIEAQELQMMTDKQVADYRLQLDDVKVRGKDVPRPVKNWAQCGLSGRVMDVLKKSGFSSPMPIQAQAIPVIMSGRDCIGIAMTGSGKTLAYVLPLLRHIKAQKPLERGDGPIGLIMGPTRELVHQIGRDVKKFSKSENIQCVTVYGGSGVSDQITELKRGTEIIVATPGRYIDILVTSGGKITNLRRVTYLVLDEADRMFDMGFEPQINRIVGNIRPTRQTVMFSATFPRSVEMMAKQSMQAPVEIQVGGRSVVNKDITQYVEIRQHHERFMRLLEILGNWQEQGKVLVFVNSQEQCDKLFRDLLQVSYGCLSLHGGKDQTDRESTINDFKNDVCSLLIATSVAARGLDVKDLVVVINYDPPNHHEDYVHRVGRTGRAGNKGTAYTFICEEEEKYAPDLVKALTESNAAVPQDLQDMADSFTAKWKRGEAQAHGSGYGGHGFKFDNTEDELRNAERKAAAKELRTHTGLGDSDEEADDRFGGEVRRSAPQVSVVENSNLTAEAKSAQEKAIEIAKQLAKPPAGWQQNQPANSYLPNGDPSALLKAAQDVAQSLNMKHGIPIAQQPTSYRPMVPAGMAFEAEIEINDFHQHARWKVTHRETIADLTDRTGAAITIKGYHQPDGYRLPEGERKIYLLIEGPSEQVVKECKREIKKILEEATERALRRDAATGGGRYNV